MESGSLLNSRYDEQRVDRHAAECGGCHSTGVPLFPCALKNNTESSSSCLGMVCDRGAVTKVVGFVAQASCCLVRVGCDGGHHKLEARVCSACASDTDCQCGFAMCKLCTRVKERDPSDSDDEEERFQCFICTEFGACDLCGWDVIPCEHSEVVVQSKTYWEYLNGKDHGSMLDSDIVPQECTLIKVHRGVMTAEHKSSWRLQCSLLISLTSANPQEAMRYTETLIKAFVQMGKESYEQICSATAFKLNPEIDQTKQSWTLQRFKNRLESATIEFAWTILEQLKESMGLDPDRRFRIKSLLDKFESKAYTFVSGVGPLAKGNLRKHYKHLTNWLCPILSVDPMRLDRVFPDDDLRLNHVNFLMATSTNKDVAKKFGVESCEKSGYKNERGPKLKLESGSRHVPLTLTIFHPGPTLFFDLNTLQGHALLQGTRLKTQDEIVVVGMILMPSGQ